MWHDPGVPLAFPVESASTCDATGTRGIVSRPRRERIPPLELGGGNGAPLDEGGTRDSSRVETGMSGNFLSCSKGVKDPLEVTDVRCD